MDGFSYNGNKKCRMRETRDRERHNKTVNKFFSSC